MIQTLTENTDIAYSIAAPGAGGLVSSRYVICTVCFRKCWCVYIVKKDHYQSKNMLGSVHNEWLRLRLSL